MRTELISQMRAAYGTLQTIDPCGEGYQKLCELLDSLDDAGLLLLAGAGVKFVSKLAMNRCVRRGLV